MKKGLLGRQNILEYGSCFVDATNKKIIQGIESVAIYKNHPHSFFSKDENENQCVGDAADYKDFADIKFTIHTTSNVILAGHPGFLLNGTFRDMMSRVMDMNEADIPAGTTLFMN